MSPELASRPAHRALPLPHPTPCSAWMSSIATTRAPARAATAAVPSVLRSSTTSSSSTRPPGPVSCWRIAVTSDPTVPASSRHGMHTDMVRPRLAASASATVQAGKLRT